MPPGYGVESHLYQRDTQLIDLKTLLASLPPSTNPFDFIAESVRKRLAPPTSGASLRTLEAIFVFHIIICISCLTILILPFLRGKRASIWLVKKLYITDNENQKICNWPMYLPNSGVTMAISQLCGSILTEAYIGIMYRTHKDPKYWTKAQPLILLCLMYNFEFLCYWTMAWNSLYTRLYSDTEYATNLKFRRRRTIPPSLYNFVFIGFAILVTILNGICARFLSISLNLRTQAWFRLADGLNYGSTMWEKLKEPSSDQAAHATLLKELLDVKKRAEKLGVALAQGSKLAISRFRLISVLWTAVMVVTLIVFIYSLGTLLLVIHRSIAKDISLSNSNPSGGTSQSRSGSDTPLKNARLSPTTERRTVMMRRRLYHLAFRGGVMVISITVTLVVCIISGIGSLGILSNPTWRSALSWTALISGTIATIPITFQCWRMYRDGDSIIPKSDQKNANSTRPLPLIKENNSDTSTLMIKLPEFQKAFWKIATEGAASAENIALDEMKKNPKLEIH